LVGLPQYLIFEVGSVAEDVSVGIDQARQNRCVSEVNDRAPAWNLDLISRPDFCDPVAADQDHLIRREFVGPCEQAAGTDDQQMIGRGGSLRGDGSANPQ
jgi:hypothetical protein